MRVNEFKVMKRRNLGNYEHEEITLSVVVEENDDLDQVIKFTLNKVKVALGLEPVVNAEGANNEQTKRKAAKKTTKKTVKAKTSETESKSVPKEDDKKNSSEAVSTVTLATVKAELGNVWKAKGKAIAADILKDFGVDRSDKLPVEVYADVLKATQKCLA